MTRRERRAGAPSANGVREAPFRLRSADDGDPDDGLTLDGYGAVFNSLTVIDSWEGRFQEQIAPGSMKRSFRETPPKVQFDHGSHPLIGSIPIASLRSISEDSDPELAPSGGAHIVARIYDNWLMQPVRDAIASDPPAISGMSFRFSVVREGWTYADGKPIKDPQSLMVELDRTFYDDVPDDDLPIRTLRELKVPEVGPVVWPAYSDTSVSVRSTIIDLSRLHEPGQRKLLATAVFLADAAESEDDDAQRDTQAVVEHPSEPDNAQQVTAPAVDERATKSPGAQQATAIPAVGEHPSKPRTLSPKNLRLRNQRDRLLTLRAVGERAL